MLTSGRKAGPEGAAEIKPKTRTNNKLNPHIMPSLGIEPGPHWWEASALFTTPSLFPAVFTVVNAGLKVS